MLLTISRAMRFVALVLALVVTFAIPGGTATADDPASDREIQIERQLGCPICTNLPLNVCDNAICQQMKGVIRQKLSDGETSDQIVAYFVSRYGDGVLLLPPDRGFNLAVWYLPVAVVLVGALIVWWFVRASIQRQRAIHRRLGAEDLRLERYRQAVRRDVAELGDQS
jgi:cytochrome c-type biogenesis protein CcmH